jgi:hypothetical protein
MTAKRWHAVIMLGMAACCVAGPALADDSSTPAILPEREASDAVRFALVRDLFEPPSSKARRSGPDWLRRISNVLGERQSAGDDWHVALQRERGDGADLLTVRHPLADLGPVHTYAGAGINRALYFADTNSEPVVLLRRNRQRSLGAAAEVGAEFRWGERLAMQANLRWIDLADDAGILSDGDALIGADPLAIGLSVGWRFP